MIRKLVTGNQAVIAENLQQMEIFAVFFSKILLPGNFIALTGALGSGKTAFTKLLCRALGVETTVSSPTFTLLNEYKGTNITILHGDLYRLSEKEIERSLEEMESFFESSNSIILIEWADKAPQLKYRWTWHMDFSFKSELSESARIISIESNRYDELKNLLDKINNAC